jgi:nicotinamide-nucleotide amidase
VRAKLDTTYGAAITGVAGPGGGTPEKPVGTVHIAVAGPHGVTHRRIDFPGTREMIRRLSCFWAMAILRKDLQTNG